MAGLIVGIRIFLGFIFLISSVSKFLAPHWFVNNVINYRILPMYLAKAYGWVLPFLELGAALLLISGWYAHWGALAVIIMTISFIFAMCVVIKRRQNLSCGCFGLLYRERIGWPTLIRDIIIVAMAALVLRFDNGALSIPKVVTDFPSLSSIIILMVTVLAITVSLILALISIKPDLLRTQNH